MNIRTPAIAVFSLSLVALWANACGSDGAGASPPPPDVVDSMDVARMDAAPTLPDSGTHFQDTLGGGTGPDTGPDWVLPPIDRACDRVVSCGVDACAGWTWSSSGRLFEACSESCDEALTERIQAADDCDAVLAIARPAIAALDSSCDSDPCAPVCGHLAECIASECSDVDSTSIDAVESDCLRTCDPDETGWINQFPDCGSLIQAISDADANFAAFCHAAAPDCPTEQACALFSEKAARCVVEHCGGDTASYEQGIRWMFDNYCVTTEPCIDAVFVTHVNDAAVDCEDPALASFGHDPPLTALCDGTLGVSVEQVRGVCEALLLCAGADWLPNVDVCSALLVTLDEPAAVVTCLERMRTCADRWTCFPEAQ